MLSGGHLPSGDVGTLPADLTIWSKHCTASLGRRTGCRSLHAAHRSLQVQVSCLSDAHEQIDHAIAMALRQRLPVYINVCCNIAGGSPAVLCVAHIQRQMADCCHLFGVDRHHCLAAQVRSIRPSVVCPFPLQYTPRYASCTPMRRSCTLGLACNRSKLAASPGQQPGQPEGCGGRRGRLPEQSRQASAGGGRPPAVREGHGRLCRSDARNPEQADFAHEAQSCAPGTAQRVCCIAGYAAALTRLAR